MTNLIDVKHCGLGQDSVSLESLFCLQNLIARGELKPNAELSESDKWFETNVCGSCDICPHKSTCLAVRINE